MFCNVSLDNFPYFVVVVAEEEYERNFSFTNLDYSKSHISEVTGRIEKRRSIPWYGKVKWLWVHRKCPLNRISIFHGVFYFKLSSYGPVWSYPYCRHFFFACSLSIESDRCIKYYLFRVTAKELSWIWRFQVLVSNFLRFLLVILNAFHFSLVKFPHITK